MKKSEVFPQKEVRYIQECRDILAEFEAQKVATSNHFVPQIIVSVRQLNDFARVVFERNGKFYGAGYSLANDFWLCEYGGVFENGMLNAVQGVGLYGVVVHDFTTLQQLIDYVLTL